MNADERRAIVREAIEGIPWRALRTIASRTRYWTSPANAAEMDRNVLRIQQAEKVGEEVRAEILAALEIP